MSHLRLTVSVFAVVLASFAHAQGPTLIGGRDFTLGDASLGGGTELVGSASNTANGLTANTPWGNSGDGISYRFNSPSEFRYDFASPVTIDGNFYLYNGWDFEDQAIRNFSLSFRDSAGSLIGSPFQAVGSAGVNDNIYGLPQVYPGVRTATLRVESPHTPHIEFREVAFDGSRCSIDDLVSGNVAARAFDSLPGGEPKAVEIVFQPKCAGSPVTLAEAANIGGYTHFNWFSIVRSAPEGGPFPKADGVKNPSGQPHGGWDSSPLYWEEEPSGKDPRYVIGHQYNTPDEYTLRFEDKPAYSPLLWDGDPPMSFVTILVGIKGPLNKWDLLSGWEWTSTNRGLMGGVEPPNKIFELGNLDTIFLDEGGIAGIREITQADMPLEVRQLLIQLGGQNIIPEPSTWVLVVFAVCVFTKHNRRSTL